MTKLLSKFAVLLLLVASSLSVSLSAYAHQIRMSVYPEESYIEGEVYFVGGANPAGAGVKVELLKDGKVVGTAVADEEGFFTIDPVVPDSYSVRGDGGQGHVAYYELDKSEFPVTEAVPEPEAKAVTEQVVTTQVPQAPALTEKELRRAISTAIRPLQEKIDHYEAKTRMHDILGGIGYILGLFGLLVLIRNRKTAQA